MSSASSESGRTPVPPIVATGAVHGRIAYLDGWRGLAIVSVLIGHFATPYWRPISVLGGFGVDLFFALSGRLMAEILFVGKQPLPVFFRRRFARIFPGLFVFATLMAMLSLLAPRLHGRGMMRPWEYASALTFTINYVQALSGRQSQSLAHIWSLSIEEHCYVLLALAALLIARSAATGRWLFLVIGIAALLNGVGLFHAGAGGVHEIYWRTDVRLAPAFLSASAYLWLHGSGPDRPGHRPRLGRLPLPALVVAGLAFFLAPVPVTYSLSAVLLALSVNMLDFAPGSFLKILSMPALTRFGLFSYSIYLWQQPIYRLNGSAHGLVLVLIVLGLAGLSYFLVEKPARLWLNRSPGRKAGPSRADVAPRPAPG